MNARLLPVVVMTSVALLAQGQPPTRVVPPAPASAPRGVRFDDVTTSAGLDGVRHVSGSAAKEYIPETTGSGVALVDADGDGWLDLCVAGYVEFDVAHPPPSPSTPAVQRRQLPTRPRQARAWARSTPPRGLPGAPDHLFRNNGDGTFTETTHEAGVVVRERRGGAPETPSGPSSA